MRREHWIVQTEIISEEKIRDNAGQKLNFNMISKHEASVFHLVQDLLKT